MWFTRPMTKVALSLGLTLVVNSTSFANVGRPDPEHGPTQVRVRVFLYDVDDVNGASQSFEANVFFQLRWHDPRLIHDNLDGVSRSLSEIWHPQIQLLNQQQVWKTFPDVISVSPNGDATYFQRVWGSFSQPLELSDFPFDRQLFEIQIVAAGHTTEMVDLQVDPRSRIADQFSLPDWTIIDWKMESRLECRH